MMGWIEFNLISEDFGVIKVYCQYDIIDNNLQYMV